VATACGVLLAGTEARLSPETWRAALVDRPGLFDRAWAPESLCPSGIRSRFRAQRLWTTR